MNEILREILKNQLIPFHEKETIKRLDAAVKKMADYDSAESFEEFMGMKIARKIYKEYMRQTKAKYEQ